MSSPHDHSHGLMLSFVSLQTSVELDELDGCIVFNHLRLGELRVSADSKQPERNAAGYIVQLDLVCKQKRAALQQLKQSQQQRAEQVRAKQFLSNLEGEASDQDSEDQAIREYAELTAAKEDVEKLERIIEDLSAVLFMFHRGYCGGEVFDCAVEKLGAAELFTTVYRPIGE